MVQEKLGQYRIGHYNSKWIQLDFNKMVETINEIIDQKTKRNSPDHSLDHSLDHSPDHSPDHSSETEAVVASTINKQTMLTYNGTEIVVKLQALAAVGLEPNFVIKDAEKNSIVIDFVQKAETTTNGPSRKRKRLESLS